MPISLKFVGKKTLTLMAACISQIFQKVNVVNVKKLLKLIILKNYLSHNIMKNKFFFVEKKVSDLSNPP